jgi:uncharacterized protein (DUF697 family)
VPAGLSLRELAGTVRDVRRVAASERPIVVDGLLAAELARRLSAGGDVGAVRVGGDPGEGSALLMVLAGQPSEGELRQLRAATRALVPIVAVQTGRDQDVLIPYVLATDVVPCPPGQAFPVEAIAAALARRLGPEAVALAARLPTLREEVTEQLVASASLRAAFLGLATRATAARFPLLAAVQTRLMLNLAAAYGREIGPQRGPEVGAVAATGLTLRAVVRRLGLGSSRPVAGLSAYTGTRAVGEAALRRFRVDSPGEARARRPTNASWASVRRRS